MRIRSLKLERFRGARSLRLDLDERLNVFVGVNGAGKSTILDAAAILLSWFMNRIKQSGKSFLSAFCRAASPRERPIYIETTA